MKITVSTLVKKFKACKTVSGQFSIHQVAMNLWCNSSNSDKLAKFDNAIMSSQI